MAEIERGEGRAGLDYMARDYDSLLRSMRESIPYKLPEWTDYESEADFGNVLLQLFAHMGDLLSYYQDRVFNESFLGTAQTRRSVVHHLRLIGYKLATAAPASAVLRLGLPADCEAVLRIERGDAFATRSSREQPSVRFEYTRETPLLIDCAALPLDAEGRKFFSDVPVEEGKLVAAEILGESSGEPNQSFPLAHARLILRSLGQGQAINRDIILWTELGEGPGRLIEEWALQDSLAFSREGQRDFAIEIDEDDRATIRFGDGAFGAVPPYGALVRASYRVGGGRHGNVPAGSIQTVVNAPQLALLPARVTNPAPATGGADRESIAHAVQHAPRVFRSLKRAVTADDYRALALDFRGVGKVRAEAESWNLVKLFVAPDGGGHVSDVLRANLIAYFEDKRPVTTLIDVEDVEYVRIYVTAEIGVKSYYAPEVVRDQVRAAGRALLAFDNVDFGMTLYLSKFYEAIEGIQGVEFVNIPEFRRVGRPALETLGAGKIELAPREIPRAPDEQDEADDPRNPGDPAAYVSGIQVIIPDEGEPRFPRPTAPVATLHVPGGVTRSAPRLPGGGIGLRGPSPRFRQERASHP